MPLPHRRTSASSIPPPSRFTPLELFQQHVEKWKDCTACELHKTRNSVVFARGQVPCDVLCCAEAPGESENIIGLPLVGPAGQLFDAIMAAALPSDMPRCYCNMVCCIPYDETGSKPAGQDHGPPVESIEACGGRLIEFIGICKPKLIVCVGKVSEEWLDVKWTKSVMFQLAPEWIKKIPQVAILHPAYLLRQNEASRVLLINRTIIQVRQAVREYIIEKGVEP